MHASFKVKLGGVGGGGNQMLEFYVASVTVSQGIV